MLRAMVCEALHLKSLLPPSDTGSIALMVARSKLSSSNVFSISVIEEYLQEQGVPFSLLGRSPYQSWPVKQVLLFYRLIVDRHQDAELERLLYSVLLPQQIGILKRIAQQHRQSLIDMVSDAEVLKQIDVTSNQQEALVQQLAILSNFDTESHFADVWQTISELPGGPLALTEQEKQEREELDEVLQALQDKTVAEALKYIDSHVTFVEEHLTGQQLFVTTIDHAKSQAFDTVFLLGAHSLTMTSPNDKARLYVSVTRARQRIFFLIDDRLIESQKNNTFLSGIPRELYQEIVGGKSVETVSS